MDFSTRDSYRHVVEKIARLSGASEMEVADIVLQLAQATRTRHGTRHPGARGLLPGRRRRGADPGRGGRVRAGAPARAPASAPHSAAGLPDADRRDHGTVHLGTAVGSFPDAASPVCRCGRWLVLAVVAFSEMGIALVNWAATVLVAPRPLPRMDFSKGIPADSRTLVVVPSMLGSMQGVDSLVEGLEVRFLANRDRHLHFALLTDFLDADQQTLAGR